MKQQRLVLDKKHTLVNNKDQDNNQNYLPFTQIGYRDVFTRFCLFASRMTQI